MSDLDLSLDECLDVVGAGRNHKARIELTNLRAAYELALGERDEARASELVAHGEARAAVEPAPWPDDEELDEVLLCNGLEHAFVGLVERFGLDPIACYDLDRVLDGYVERDGMTWDEAQEFFDFNVIGAWVGERTPCFIRFVKLPPPAAA